MACGCRDAATCGCRIDGTAPVTVDGAGTVDAPYAVGLTISPDPNNILTIEPDGLAALESQFPGHCFMDDLGQTLTPDPGTGCYTIPRKACILDPGGNPLPEDVNGCVSLPEAGIPSYGRGLNANPQGALEVALSGAWPIQDPTGGNFQGAASGGAPIFVDELGLLRTVPDHTVVTAASATIAVWTGSAFVANGTTAYSSNVGTISIKNPSASRFMVVMATMIWNVVMGGPANGDYYLTPQYDLAGGNWASPGNITQLHPPFNVTGATVEAGMYGTMPMYFGTLSPGDTFNFNARLAISNSSSGSTVARETGYMRTMLIGMTR